MIATVDRKIFVLARKDPMSKTISFNRAYHHHTCHCVVVTFSNGAFGPPLIHHVRNMFYEHGGQEEKNGLKVWKFPVFVSLDVPNFKRYIRITSTVCIFTILVPSVITLSRPKKQILLQRHKLSVYGKKKKKKKAC